MYRFIGPGRWCNSGYCTIRCFSWATADTSQLDKEFIIMRFTDIMLAIPPLAMALAITAVLSPNLTQDDCNYHALVDMAYQTYSHRIVKAQMNEDYVEAAKVAGASHFHIMFRELLPNCISAISVKISLDENGNSFWCRPSFSCLGCSHLLQILGRW